MARTGSLTRVRTVHLRNIFKTMVMKAMKIKFSKEDFVAKKTRNLSTESQGEATVLMLRGGWVGRLGGEVRNAGV